MPQQWARFPCPQCGKIVQENWGKCFFCGADLKAEKEKLAAQRRAAQAAPAQTQEQTSEIEPLPIPSRAGRRRSRASGRG